MSRAVALAALAALVAATTTALFAPLAVLAPAAALGLALAPRRLAMLGLAASTIAIHVAILALADPEGGWIRGLVGGLRLVAALALNLAILARFGAARILEGLRLPPRTSAFLAAILLAAHDVGRDFARLRDARRLEGAWPRGRLARAREAARLVAPLVLAAHRRAQKRREALHLAGHAVAPWFVPVVAVAALCAAGRLAFLALPNVALTYVVAFVGGLLYGPRVAAAGAFVGMALTDLILSGLYPGGFVNAPAMALVGALGGALRRVRLDAAASGAIGILATFAFSLAADTVTWALLYRDPAAYAPLLVAGLVFNVVPALVNGALFAASVTPTVRAFRAWQEAAQSAPAAPASPAAATPAT